MKDWQQILREGDPGVGRLDADTAARLRETVTREARTAIRTASVWRVRFALAAFACIVLMLSVMGTRRHADAGSAVTAPVAGTERRQIQFATPGGTRIIWEINPHFTLGETVP